MKEIENRNDIHLLVSTFYDRIRSDLLLGPIFNMHIANDKWPAHVNKLTDFWTTGLFGVVAFKGNPTQAHRNVDENLKHTIDEKHFKKWLFLWLSTVDSLFTGALANRAKEAAKKMAIGQFNTIIKVRPQQSQPKEVKIKSDFCKS